MIEVIVNSKGDEYVGLDIINNNITLHLPIGYNFPFESNVYNIGDIPNEVKNEIKNIMMFLSKKSKISLKSRDVFEDIDFLSVINVINDYTKYGLYKQSELKRKNNFKGRINWKRTINQNKMLINNRIIYSNIVNEYIDYKSEKEIQKIQELCLYQISNTVGFLFNFNYPKIVYNYNKKEIIELLKKEIKNTNEDTKYEILLHLLCFLENINNKAIKNGNISIKYREFQYIFQDLIDYYGINDKSNFYPKAEFRYWNNNKICPQYYIKPSNPDTLIIDNKELLELSDTIFILDAKYKGELLNEYDIFKQIRYKKYVENIIINKRINKNIKNIFVLPRNLIKNNLIVKIEEFYATSEDYHENEKIFIVYVDTKSLINNTQMVMKKLLYEVYNYKEF